MRNCTAQSRRTGKPCKAHVVNGRTACYHHGGRSPRGLASPQFQHGKYSKDLPSHLAVQYEKARNDPELTSLRDEIAVAETRFRELLQRLQDGDAGALWPALSKAKDAYTKARGTEAEPAAIAAMLALIDQGQQDWALWQSIHQVSDHLARLRTAEHRRLVDMRLMITAESANAMLAVIVNVVMSALRKNIGDTELIRRVYADVSRGLDAHLN